VIIVDSTVWIDHFNGIATREVQLLHACLGQRELGIGDLILCEVLQGFREDREFLLARRALLSFPVFDVVGPGLAERAARNYRLLRKRGVTIRKTIDVLIATFVIERGFALLHRDSDFDPFEHVLGLAVVRP
jgi:predicted nucleic acid-binding protein